MNSFGKLLAAVALCQCVSLAVGNPNVISFADFMEFDVGAHKACEGNPGGDNTTFTIINQFTECSLKLSDTEPKDVFENFAAICIHRPKYLGCWDSARAEILEKCGKDKGPALAAAYRGTVEAFCGSDNGAAKIEELKKASSEPVDPMACPEQTVHWAEKCEKELVLFNSPDVCARHTALEQCLGIITCDKVMFARILKGIYADGRKHLNC